MDLTVEGRHALLFDDDATAAFVNCRDALVPWSADAALFIDRYDVRHLLDRIPPRPPLAARRRHQEELGSTELDIERYLDLPPPSNDEDEAPGAVGDNGEGTRPDEIRVSVGGYQAVPFSYGTTENSADLEKLDSGSTYSGYHPPFPLPKSLLNNLPPTEKLHQIIARTAVFVSEHGGQSEIVLRVKQGDNPTFGFLMPDHHLHLYYRFLVEHPQLLNTDQAQGEKKVADGDNEPSAAPGGALSLLGSIYGSGEDDDGIQQTDDKVVELGNLCASANVLPSERVEQLEAPASDELGDKKAVKHSTSFATSKEKTISIKKNLLVNSSLINASHRKKTKDGKTSSLGAMEKLQSTQCITPHAKASILEPPSFMKRMVDKIVDLVSRNGRESEAVVIEQDKTVGRYPFLLPSNLYHAYYLKALEDAREGNAGSKTKLHVNAAKRAATDDILSDVSEGWLYDSQRKEKFKMVIGGPKKESHDQQPAPARQTGVSADEAAAIVLAATRGVSPANIPRFSVNESVSSHKYGEGQDALKPASSNDVGSSLRSSSQQLGQDYSRTSDDAWIAKAIANSAALAASFEADSSEVSLTKEQKLKAERLRRAKLFAAMIKSGVPTSKLADSTSLDGPVEVSVSGSVHSSSVSDVAKEREGSSVPSAAEAFARVKPQERDSKIDYKDKHSSRKKHHSRSKDHSHEDNSEESDKQSKKRHRSEHSVSHRSGHRHSKSHSSSRDKESRHHHNHHSSSEDEYRHTKTSRSRHCHRDHYTSEDEDTERKRSDRHKKRHHSQSKRDEDFEKDDTTTNLDQVKKSSRSSNHHQEGQWVAASDDQTTNSSAEVPSDLRAKIRAMLLETM